MKVLIIEDDYHLCEVVALQLKKEGYQVEYACSGEDGLFCALQSRYDVIVLDRMLPVMDGITVLKAIRNKGIRTPVILVTALGEVSDRIEGLDSGADDYLTKPFSVPELSARLRALARRPTEIEVEKQYQEIGDITIDLSRMDLSCGGMQCHLSRREFHLFLFFAGHQNIPLKREQILNHVWGVGTEVELGNVDNYIHFLRRRLKQLNSTLSIKSVYGVGFMLEVLA